MENLSPRSQFRLKEVEAISEEDIEKLDKRYRTAMDCLGNVISQNATSVRFTNEVDDTDPDEYISDAVLSRELPFMLDGEHCTVKFIEFFVLTSPTERSGLRNADGTLKDGVTLSYTMHELCNEDGVTITFGADRYQRDDVSEIDGVGIRDTVDSSDFEEKLKHFEEFVTKLKTDFPETDE